MESEASPRFVVIRVEGDKEPLGAVAVRADTLISVLRSQVVVELEVLRNFRFLRRIGKEWVKINIPQEFTTTVGDLGGENEVFVRYYQGRPGTFVNADALSDAELPKADDDAKSTKKNGRRRRREKHGAKRESSSESDDSDSDVGDSATTKVLEGEPIDSVRLLSLPFNANWFDEWDRYAGDVKHTLPLYKTSFAMYQLLKKPLDPNSSQFLCLNALISNIGPSFETTSDQSVPSRDVFVRLMQTFGPLNGILERIEEAVAHVSFHGALDMDAAERLVRTRSGNYLVRLSNRNWGALAVSTRHGGKCAHYSVTRSEDGMFEFGSSVKCKTLPELMGHLKGKLKLKYPVPCEKFREALDPDPKNQRAYDTAANLLG